MKKAISLIAAIMLVFCVLALPVRALSVDMTRRGSITVSMIHDGEPVPGGSLTLYRVADIQPGGGEDVFRYEEAFAGCEVALHDIGPDTASALASFVYYNGIEGQTRKIDENGLLKFENLEVGLYLLIQWEAAEGFYEVFPFLVSIPSNKDGEYVYDVDSVPKQELNPEPTEPTKPSEPTVPSEPTEPSEPSEPTKPTEPDLPQTGQTNWPIPILAVSGIFFVILGILLMVRDGRHHEEV